MKEEELNEISGCVVDAAVKVHSQLGPGLLESAYQSCLAHELQQRGRQVKTEEAFPVVYDGLELDVGYRVDMLVDEEVVVETKAVEKIHPVHEAQLLSYLKLGKKKVGLLLNFNVKRMKDGIKRMVNKL
ncbi:MAG: GxxExxY protein [Planctomycetota bacterium]